MTFRDIRGQDQAIALLRASLASGRLAHAYLFFGPEGIGKRTAALAFAAALNCLSPDAGGDACGACLSCRKIRHGNHPDVAVVSPEGAYIRIHAIRELQDRLLFRPLEGRRRVLLLNEAERLHHTAANALLKTLEEPAPANILVLVSSRPRLLPATILSRCQRIRFRPLAPEVLFPLVQQHAGLAEEQARLLAWTSGGSLSRALDMHREAFLARRREILACLELPLQEDPLARFAFLAAFGQDRAETLAGLAILASCWRDALVYRETGEADRIVNRDAAAVIQTLAAGLRREEILANLAAANRACRALERNANRLLTLEAMATTVQGVQNPPKEREGGVP